MQLIASTTELQHLMHRVEEDILRDLPSARARRAAAKVYLAILNIDNKSNEAIK